MNAMKARIRRSVLSVLLCNCCWGCSWFVMLLDIVELIIVVVELVVDLLFVVVRNVSNVVVNRVRVVVFIPEDNIFVVGVVKVDGDSDGTIVEIDLLMNFEILNNDDVFLF